MNKHIDETPVQTAIVTASAIVFWLIMVALFVTLIIGPEQICITKI